MTETLVDNLRCHVPPGQLGRYLLVGVWNTLFGYLSFAALTAILSPFVSYGYIVASVLASLLNITVAFIGYKHFVFKTKGHYLREWTRCVAVYGSGIALNLTLLPIFVALIRRWSPYSKGAPYIAGAFLTGFGVIYSFFGHKRFSFRKVTEP